MDYRKYLKEGFQLKEFTNVKDGQDMGELWHKADELGKNLKAKVDNKEPLTDEDKKELNNVIHTGEEYLNALKANFAADPEGGSPIERECAGLVEGKESIEDHLKVYKELLSGDTPSEDANTATDNDTHSRELEIISNAIDNGNESLKSYMTLKYNYDIESEKLKNNSTNTGADIPASSQLKSLDDQLNRIFNEVNKNLELGLENRDQLDRILDELQPKANSTSNDTESEIADIENEELDEVAEAKEDAFRAYYFIYKSENNARAEYANALRSNDPVAVQNAENKKNQLIKSKTDTLTKCLEIINTAIEHVNAENRMKGDISKPEIAKIATIKDLEEELLKYFSDPAYADVKERVEQEMLGDEAQEALAEGDPSKITALANTFSATFKTEQDIDVWKKCILRYAKLLAAYNTMMTTAINEGLIPSKMEEAQKYLRYATMAVTIASFIPPLNAATVPLSILSGGLRFSCGLTTAVLQGKKVKECIDKHDYKHAAMHTIAACFGAYSAFSGFTRAASGLSTLAKAREFSPDSLVEYANTHNIAGEIQEKQTMIDHLKNGESPIYEKDASGKLTLKGWEDKGYIGNDVESKVKALEAEKTLLESKQNAISIVTGPDKNAALEYSKQISGLMSGQTSPDELNKWIADAHEAASQQVNNVASSVMADLQETAIDNAMDQIPPNPLEALQNMPEAEAREMANKWAANSGWYANVMANGTEEDKVKAIYALKAINNSVDGQKQIALYNELRKVSANISNTDKLLNGTGGYMSQQADLYADVSKNVKGSIYNNLGKVWGKDVPLTDEQRHGITAKLYDACTTHGSDSTLSVGQVQKILTDNGINNIEDQKKCLSSIFTGYKTNMDPTKVLTPKDTNVFKLADQVKSGDLSGVQGKILDGSLQNAYNDNAAALTNKIGTLQNNLATQQATQASLRNQINGMF